MGINRGANIVRDGLVFGFDIGYPMVSSSFDSNRFNSGEPTTNEANTDTKRTIVGHSLASYGHIVTSSNAPEKGIGWKKFTIGSQGSNHRIAQFPYIGHLANKTKNYSLEYDFSGLTHSTGIGTSGYYFKIDGSAGTFGQSNKDNGYQKSMKYFRSVDSTMGIFLCHNTVNRAGVNETVYYRNYQVEEKLHNSPFVETVRSVSSSLIDLVSNTDIDLSYVSFDTNGQLEFDGTSNYIAITNLLASQAIGNSTKLTISLWLNPDTHGSTMAFSTGQVGNDRIYHWTTGGINTWRVGNYTSTTGHGALPSIGNWYNTVLVIDGLSVKSYLNGVEDYTGNYTAFTTSNYATFGRHGARTEYYYNGKIAVARIYERALSEAEIKQNYNANKNRFDI